MCTHVCCVPAARCTVCTAVTGYAVYPESDRTREELVHISDPYASLASPQYAADLCNQIAACLSFNWDYLGGSGYRLKRVSSPISYRRGWCFYVKTGAEPQRAKQSVMSSANEHERVQDRPHQTATLRHHALLCWFQGVPAGFGLHEAKGPAITFTSINM